MYKFSVPMPYNKKHIDKIVEINKFIEKSKITNLFFSLPCTSNMYVGFEQPRNNAHSVTFDTWKDIIAYSVEKGFDIVYLLNSSNALNELNKDYSKQLELLDKLINELRKIGCYKYRIANPQLIHYMIEKYPYVDIYGSTTLEYKTINEYRNFLKVYPNIKHIVPSHDINKNFKLLKNIRKIFPELEIEMMVNEGCINGCPNRNWHAGNLISPNETSREEVAFYKNRKNFYLSKCSPILFENPALYLAKLTVIFPFQIKEYSKIGINNFKLIGRDSVAFESGEYLKFYLFYLRGIDDENSIDNISISCFINYIKYIDKFNRIYIGEIKPYLPKIEHFIKYGHLCASICGVECFYCYKCAEKIKKKLNLI